jgi:hypothetical protein
LRYPAGDGGGFMRGLLTLVLAFLLLAGPAAASGRIVFKDDVSELEVCDAVHTWTVKDSDAPAAVAKILAVTGPRVLVRTCEDFRHLTHTFVRSDAIIPQRNGVCRMREEEVFPDANPNASIAPGGKLVKGWRRLAPAEWLAEGYKENDALVRTTAFVGDVPCPPPDDPRYITVDNLTDGTLKQFDALWRHLTVSQAGLLKAFRALPIFFVLKGHEDEVRARAAARIAADPTLTVLACNPGPYGDQPYCQAWSNKFVFDFDVGPKGLELQRMSPVNPY